MLKKLKNIIGKISKSFAFSYFILIMIIFLPTAITMPSLSFRSAIITAIGVDRSEEGVEVSVLTLSEISKDNMGENTKLVSGSNSTVASAISSIESQIGRKLRMGHVGYIAISQDLATENIANVLNNLIITTKLPNTVSLVVSEGNAKDILKQTDQLEQSSSFKLREIIQNEFNVNYTKDTSVDAFLKGYLSDISTSTLGYIKLTSNEDEGLNSSEESGSSPSTQGGGASSGDSGQSSNSNSNDKTTISFQREHAVFVNGVLKYVLSLEEMKGINWLVESDLQQILTIENYTGQGLNNAKITFDVIGDKITPKVYFKNNKPIITYDLFLTVNPVEIIQENKNYISPNELKIDEVVNDKINQKIKSEISNTIFKLREEKTDVFGVYKLLYSTHYYEFMDFLDSLENRDDFLSYVQFKINVFPKIIAN